MNTRTVPRSSTKKTLTDVLKTKWKDTLLLHEKLWNTQMTTIFFQKRKIHQWHETDMKLDKRIKLV